MKFDMCIYNINIQFAITDMTVCHSGKFTAFELETFRQLTDDSLMPWLQANEHPLKFETITRLVAKKCAMGHNYFSALIEAFAQTAVKLPASLIAEWEMFSRVKPVNTYNSVKFIFEHATSRDKKYAFYYNLIAKTIRSGLGLQAQLFEATASVNLRKRMITNNLKRCIGMMQRCGGSQSTSTETAAIAKVLLAGLRVFYIESILQYKGFYESHLKCFGINELTDFESDFPLPEKGNTPFMRNASELTERFVSYYCGVPNGDTHADSVKDKLTGMHNKSDEFYEKFSRFGNLLTGFDEKYRSIESLSFVQEDSSDTGQSLRESVSEEIVADTKGLDQVSDIIRAKEVMEMLGIGRTTLYNYSKSGKIPSFKIGKTYKYEKNKILKLKETGFNK